MKRLVILLIVFLIFASPAFAAFDVEHTLFTHELQKYVEGGLVHYKRWQKSPGNLHKYLEHIAELTPAEFNGLTEDDRKALWLNVYNAFTIKLVLDHYPISGNRPYFPTDSFRQIKPDAWEAYKVSVAGKEYTLYAIEHEILRKVFHNARSHFAVVCAAKGSAALKNRAFVGRTLNQI